MHQQGMQRWETIYYKGKKSIIKNVLKTKVYVFQLNSIVMGFPNARMVVMKHNQIADVRTGVWNPAMEILYV